MRLIILRHLKTGWALPGQRDIGRQLEPRGIADAEIVAGWIGEHGLTPGHVYCSEAVRTRQTLDAITPAFEQAPGITHHPDLYSGTADDYLAVLESHGEAETLMIVGHNPSCAALANMLLDRNAALAPGSEKASIAYKYPTGAMAVFDFDIENWQDLRPGTGNLVHFLTPKPFRQPARS
ncbi:SixA phosphatase family protein [Salaquimonas pukyongi]|uniref:SixA phosphatase family protein n=1 Tax=Salaquimonas pukyongi TaxID=2712698 RepID=UPI00096BCC8B|nr:histidine phosphatase family protein [Salaquimonas pukyongi]